MMKRISKYVRVCLHFLADLKRHCHSRESGNPVSGSSGRSRTMTMRRVMFWDAAETNEQIQKSFTNILYVLSFSW
jgi:hypothetical protein